MYTSTEITRLLDIANYGTMTGSIADARAIFQSIITFFPTHSGALLGLAHNQISVGENEEARKLLFSVLEKNAHDMDAKALIGLSYFLEEKNTEAKPFLEEVQNSDSSLKQLAIELLDKM